MCENHNWGNFRILAEVVFSCPEVILGPKECTMNIIKLVYKRVSLVSRKHKKLDSDHSPKSSEIKALAVPLKNNHVQQKHLQKMEMKITLFFLLATCCSLCYSLPAPIPQQQDSSETQALSPEHDTARKLWSQAKLAYKNIMKEIPKVKRTRSRRQAAGSSSLPIDADAAFANVTGPRYIKDLYKNLTNSTSTQQANTIRSLKYSQIGKNCCKQLAPNNFARL